MLHYRIVGYSLKTEQKIDKAIKLFQKKLPPWVVSHGRLQEVFYFITPCKTSVLQGILENELRSLTSGVKHAVIERQPLHTIIPYMFGDYMQKIVERCPHLKKITCVHCQFMFGDDMLFSRLTEDSLFFDLVLYVWKKKELHLNKPGRYNICEGLYNQFIRTKCGCNTSIQ